MGSTDLRLSRLRRYPVKSCRGEDLPACEVEPWGLLGDRRWMVVDPSGRAVTAREENRLVLVDPVITGEGLRLRFPGIEDLAVVRPKRGPLAEVELWRDRIAASLADDSAHDWFSQVIGRPVRLVYLDDPRRRPVDRRYAEPSDVVSFADGFPLLVVTEESLEQLNTWIATGPRAEDGPLPITRFRPSLVIRGAEPFAEDSWRRVRVGDVVFKIVKPCARCVLTTIDPDTAERTKEPLVSLARHRKIGSKLLFAVNAIPEPPYGVVRVGDPVDVLA
ncbi:MAG: MOSC domain-containing protein [Microlunatus sp.]